MSFVHFNSRIQEQNARLKDADEKEAVLANHIKELTHQLEEATEGKDKTLSTLKQQTKDDEKVISELRTELAKQTKLARDRHIKNQYMMIEKEKLSVLSSYKDTLNVELRNTIKLVRILRRYGRNAWSPQLMYVINLFCRREFQNHIAEQLTALKEEYMNGGNASSPLSPVDTGPACSSPNTSSNDDHGLSDISLSVVERVPQANVALKANAANKDSMQFFSLATGESSRTLMPESFQKQGKFTR